MANARAVEPPSAFDFKKPEEWPKYIRRFERYRIASQLDKKSQEMQINVLMYIMEDEADDIFKSFTFTDVGDDKKYEKVREQFDKHFIVKRNVIFERAKFNNRRQEPQETVDSFITDLYCLSEFCEYRDLREDMIRDRIVVGLIDTKLSERLQLIHDLTLKRAIDMARQSELVKKQQEILRSTEAAKIEAISRKKPAFKKTPNKPQNQASGKNRRSAATKKTCQRCGSAENHARENCPAKDSTCHSCKKRGYYARVCRSKLADVDVDIGYRI